MRFRELQAMSLIGISWWLPERKWKSLSHVQLLATPWTVAHLLLCPWDSPGKNTGVGCHFLLQGIFLTQGLSPGSPELQTDSLPSEPPGKSLVTPWEASILSLHCAPDRAWMRTDWDSERSATSNCSSFTMSVLPPLTWKRHYGPRAKWRLQGQRDHCVRMKDMCVGGGGGGEELWQSWAWQPPSPPHPALMDYLFDPLLCSSEGSEESGPRRQALAQALYFGARGATAVDSQSSRRSGCNLLIKSVHHLPRVPPLQT